MRESARSSYGHPWPGRHRFYPHHPAVGSPVRISRPRTQYANGSTHRRSNREDSPARGDLPFPATLIKNASSLLSLADARGIPERVRNIRPPSSSGLGYQVLILETGVRVPVGVRKHEAPAKRFRRGLFLPPGNGCRDGSRQPGQQFARKIGRRLDG